MAFLARLPQWKIDMSKKAEGKESKHEKAKLEMMEKLERELVTAEPEEDVQTELQPISTVHRLQVLAPGTIRAGLRVGFRSVGTRQVLAWTMYKENENRKFYLQEILLNFKNFTHGQKITRTIFLAAFSKKIEITNFKKYRNFNDLLTVVT